MRGKAWGARGSVPTPGPATNRYGGKISCVEVTLSDGAVLVLDAGSGIRTLGLKLAARPRRIDILLTQLHLEHIQGLMFFAPLFIPDAEVVLWGTPDAETLPERLARYLSPPLTPLHLDELPSRITSMPERRVGDGGPRASRRPPSPTPRPMRSEDARLDLAGVDEFLMVGQSPRGRIRKPAEARALRQRPPRRPDEASSHVRWHQEPEHPERTDRPAGQADRRR